ncbi:MAG: glgP [Ignavibacteria bacterium]|nr:glgP [Ignavibacteria bacterium]
MGFTKETIFFTDSEDPESYSLENQLAEHLEFGLAKNKLNVKSRDLYFALAHSVRDRMVRRWMRTQNEYYRLDVKRVYYLSMEYMMGRLLGNAMNNLGFYEKCGKILSELGYDLEEIIDLEPDMGLGNGGLGRLAACFLDSMATLGLPAFGYGIRYEYGIFKQEIEQGAQIERPDNWLSNGNPWEIMRPEHSVRIKYYGKVISRHDQQGKLMFEWIDTEDIIAIPYDIPVPGYNSNSVNSLRLWKAQATEDFDFTSFNEGDYLGAVERKNQSENISKVLYPNDNSSIGKELRLKQEYFFVSASLQDILKKFKENHEDISIFPEKIAVQLNDTHPAIAIPELMRLLLDEEHLSWEDAWDITVRTFGYTNHTVMSEALEKWKLPLMEKVLPRHMQIIFEINFRFLEKVRLHYDNNTEIMKSMSIIEEAQEKQVRMAHLAIVGSHSVNGVANLHTEILKNSIFKYFNIFEPGKFNNKTNGITQRRWLKKASPCLSELITRTIGDKWISDLYELKKLEAYTKDNAFVEHWQMAKAMCKTKLIKYIETNYHLKINPDSIFDTQVKRIHEYKRQLLNVLHVITLYNRLRENPNLDITPRTVIFGGKAAPGYYIAKLIIKLINSVAATINSDSRVKDKLKVLFLKNYSVTLAELIMPATDLSEQISTAGYEASGTGNMKFQLNGALTIGTLDGANIEMLEELGKDNMFIFGMTDKQVTELHSDGYEPMKFYEENAELRQVLDMLKNNFFSLYEWDVFRPLFDTLIFTDKYCLLADYDSYIQKQDEAGKLFTNKSEWTKKSIINTARSGRFSSDRTIQEYASDIWKIEKVFIPDSDFVD